MRLRLLAPRTAFLGLALIMFLLGGCGLTGETVVIRFDSRPAVGTGAPVMLDREMIGKVESVGQETPKGEPAGRPVWTARASIDSKFRERLRRSSVFIADSDTAGPYLRYEIVDGNSPPVEKGQTFLGFNSYPEYLTWRAAKIGGRKLDEFFKIMDDALKELGDMPVPKPGQPGQSAPPSGKGPVQKF